MDLDLILLSLVVGAFIYLMWFRRVPNFPPGPRGIPILGNLLQLGEKPFIKFQNEWKEKYGPMIGLDFGSYRTVAISDYRMIKEGLIEPAFAGRPDMMIWQIRSRDKQARGILFTEGTENTEQRIIALKGLRQFGYQQKSFENVITSEVLNLVDTIGQTNGEPMSLKNKFHVHVLNILWHIVAGKGCEEDRQTLNQIYMNSTKIMEEQNYLTTLFMFLPWLCKYFPTMSGFNKTNSELEAIWKFLEVHIEEHKKEESEVYHDYIGSFLAEIKKSDDQPTSSFHKEVGEKSLMTSLLDLFFAGTDTISTTLHWTCLYLATNPQAQQKLCEEVDRVVGQNRLPENQDEPKMIYTQAVIQEVLRIAAITPLAIFHSATQDVNFQTYRIPKGTMILYNLHGAHHDINYWGDPETFRPERFLSPDGGSIIKHEAFFPFGLGKRVCVGEMLAKMELFLFITSIFQRFRVTPDPANPQPTMEPIVSIINMPPNHKLVFEKRH